MTAYNQKIIETPTYLEIYDYEAIITPKQKSDKNETNPKRKKELAWLYEEENPTSDKRKNYDELSAQGQYDSLKRKQKYYQNMRFEIAYRKLSQKESDRNGVNNGVNSKKDASQSELRNA
ncbi:TPA: hypothetical protein QFP44_002413 [Enterococcus faecium]